MFGVPEESVVDDMSPDTTPEWSSLAHMNLVLALEAQYGLTLSPEDAVEMLSIRLVRMILEEKGVHTR